MTDSDILRLAEPFLSMRDAAQPTIRGREDLIAFARIVISEWLTEAGRTHHVAAPVVTYRA